MKPALRRALGLWMAMMLLICLVGTGIAFPSEGGRGAEDQCLVDVPGLVLCQIADMGHHGDGPPVLISIVRSERGFALGPDDVTLPVRLQVEKVRWIDPSRVRRLLGENRTLGEIKAEIEGDDQAYGYRGSMRLDMAHYLLENLNVTLEERNSTLVAELMEPVWGVIPTSSEPGLEMAGRISIRTCHQVDGSGIGVGSLVIFGGPYAGSYVVVLDSSIGAGCEMEACPVWGGDLASFAAGSEFREIRQQGDGPLFSAWFGAGSPISFWEMISRSSGVVVISPSFGPGCGGGDHPVQPDPFWMGSGDPGEFGPEVLGLFGSRGEAGPDGIKDGLHRLRSVAYEI